MPTLTEALVPQPGAWAIPEACWLEPGTLLQSTAHRYGYLLVSPVFSLQAGCTYQFRLRLEFDLPGGVTFGLQDHAGAQWLQIINCTGTGQRTCSLQFRAARDGRFRLVLANCFPDGPAVNRLRVLGLEYAQDRETSARKPASLQIHHLEPPHLWQGPLMCVTHSERPVEIDRCNLNALTQRYGASQRLPLPVPFTQLTPAAAHNAWRGQLTVWGFEHGDWRRPHLLAQVEPLRSKPQQALWHRGRLWLLCGEMLEVYDAALRRLAVIEDPWLAGGHTLAPDNRGNLYLACSASDAVLVIDEATCTITAARRVPEALYGSNYALTRTDSVVDHFIINDFQLTHLNSAWPYQSGCLISTLIQGAIGWFDPAGSFRELTRGFVGCHGVRTNRAGEIYFSDSTLGTLAFLDSQYRLSRRVDLNSHWLHDALELDETTWAAALSDRNQVVIFDPRSAATLHTIDGSRFGASTQFLAFGQ